MSDLAERAAARRQRLRPELSGVRAAAAFLTRIPVGGHPYLPDELSWASAHFPLIGAALGALAALAFRLLAHVGPLAAGLLTIGLLMLITGAFHEDGLADTADALGGGRTRERVLEILKDSRIGSFGGAALVISIAGRAVLLATLAGRGLRPVLWALPLVGAAARTGPVWMMRFLPYLTPRHDSRAGDIVRVQPAQAMVATAWLALTLAIVVPLGPFRLARVVAMLAVLAATCGYTGWRYQVRAGGYTGDFLGATEQLCELAALVVLAWK